MIIKICAHRFVASEIQSWFHTRRSTLLVYLTYREEPIETLCDAEMLQLFDSRMEEWAQAKQTNV